MKFTIDCTTNIGKGPELRLSKDGTWRRIKWPEVASEHDVVYDDATPAATHAKSIKTVGFDGVAYDAEMALGMSFGGTPGKLGRMDNYATVFHRIHREVAPKLFSVDDVRTAIAEGDDAVDNCLAVDLSCQVVLVDEAQGHGNEIPHIAATLRRFQAENDYVGPDAANDASLVEEHHNHLLQLWKRHLLTGRCNCIDDSFPPHDTATLQAEIQELMSKVGQGS